MRGIGCERRTRAHRPENATLTPAPSRRESCHARRPSAPSLRTDECSDYRRQNATASPQDQRRWCGLCGSQSPFCTCRSHRRRHDCALRDVEIGDQRHGATPDIFELASPACPGSMSRVGCLRSSAWMPVISSVDSTRSPASTKAGACPYSVVRSAIFTSASASGSALSP